MVLTDQVVPADQAIQTVQEHHCLQRILEVQKVLEVHLVQLDLVLQAIQNHQGLQLVQFVLVALVIQVGLADLVVHWDLYFLMVQVILVGRESLECQEIQKSHLHQVIQMVLSDLLAPVVLVVPLVQEVLENPFLLEGLIVLQSLMSQESLIVPVSQEVQKILVSHLVPVDQKDREVLMGRLVLQDRFHLGSQVALQFQGFQMVQMDLFVQKDLGFLPALHFQWVQVGQLVQ